MAKRSFLPSALTAWRAVRPNSRSVHVRPDAVVLRECVRFVWREAKFVTLAAADRSIRADAIVWRRVEKATA